MYESSPYFSLIEKCVKETADSNRHRKRGRNIVETDLINSACGQDSFNQSVLTEDPETFVGSRLNTVSMAVLGMKKP